MSGEMHSFDNLCHYNNIFYSVLSKEQRKKGAERETFEEEKAARALVEELRANAVNLVS